MKRFLKIVVSIAIVLVSLTAQIAYAIEPEGVDTTSNKPADEQMSIDQAKAQIEFFHKAIDELGALTPEQAVRIWAKAEDTRNGVYHYAVACDDLKNDIIKKWGKPEDNFWIIGTSSPWVDKYDIVSSKKINDSTYEVTIKYYWATSAGPSEPTSSTLLIVKDKNKWCVKEVK